MEQFSSVAFLRWIRRNTKAKSRPDGLDAYEVSVLVILLSHAGHPDAPGFAALAPGELAAQVPMSRGQMYRALGSLTERGVVTTGGLIVGGAATKGYLLRRVSLTETQTPEMSLPETGSPGSRVSDRDTFVSDRDTFVSERDTGDNKDARAKWGMGNGERIDYDDCARDPECPDSHRRARLALPEVDVDTLHRWAQEATCREYAMSDTWRARYEHVVAHWTEAEIVESLQATMDAPRPRWAYVRGCLEKLAAEGPALILEHGRRPDVEAAPDHFPELTDEEVVELAGDELVDAWREWFVATGRAAAFPSQWPAWTELVAGELRERGITPPEGRR